MSENVPDDGPVAHLEDLSSLVTLRLLSGLAGLPLGESSMQAVLQKIAALVTELPGVQEAAAVVMGAKTLPCATAFTGLMAYELDETTHGPGFGPCLHAATNRQPVSIPDVGRETRWPTWGTLAGQKGALSSLSIPLELNVPASRGPLTAALSLYGTAPHALSAETFRAAGFFAAHAGTTLSNMITLEIAQRSAEDLHTAMQSRAVIEQAKGILVERHTMTVDQAFTRLAKSSQQINRKLRDVAREIVDHASAPLMALAGCPQGCSSNVLTRVRGQVSGRRVPVAVRRRVSVRAWWSRSR